MKNYKEILLSVIVKKFGLLEFNKHEYFQKFSCTITHNCYVFEKKPAHGIPIQSVITEHYPTEDHASQKLVECLVEISALLSNKRYALLDKTLETFVFSTNDTEVVPSNRTGS